MKKNISSLGLLFLLSFSILSSCNKSDMQDQLATTKSGNSIDDEDDVAKHHGDCSCHCPSAVAIASSFNYGISFATHPQVSISANVFYKNSGPQGTLRLVLKNVNGNIDSVVVVPAYHTNAGDSAIIHLDYLVDDYNDFPCKLYVHGRPASLGCEIRSQKVFDIIISENKNYN
ncbi:MAG: hypothetical protein ABI402_13105 [Ferruginibacter sp.]